VLPGSSSVPPAVALARPAARLPTARDAALWFEPKWDGYRLTIVRDERTTLWSRQGKDLTASFPEIAAAWSVYMSTANRGSLDDQRRSLRRQDVRPHAVVGVF